MIRAALLAATTSFLLALAIAALVRPLAARLGHVDRPGLGKRHQRPIPLGGGIAIFCAIALPLVLGPDRHASTPFLIAALVLHLGGVWDDQRALSPWAKLTVQMLAAIPLVTTLGLGVLPQWLTPVAGLVLAVLWIVAVTNAFNFLDGSDGLAGTIGALCAAMFLVAAILSGQAAEATLFALLLGALVAFLVFNLPPARMFMGDGGSQVIGFALGYGSLRLTYFDAGFRFESPWYAVFTPLVVLAIPLYDLVTVIVLRLLDRRNPMRGDDRHVIHRLWRHGLGAWGVLAVLGAATLASGIGGVMLPRLEAWQAMLVVAQTVMVLVVIALLELRLGRRIAPNDDDRRAAGSLGGGASGRRS